MEVFKIDNVTDSFLDATINRVDPLADDLIYEIMTSGYYSKFNAKFNKLSRNNSYSQKLFKGFPLALREQIDHYFNVSSQVPEWADKQLIQIGKGVFRRHESLLVRILQYKPLPMCYSFKKGAKILRLIKQLVEQRGITMSCGKFLETSKMVVDVFSPDGLKPHGKGIMTVQKVRLINALFRFLVKSEMYNPQGWDCDKLGEPINQEDLAGTLMALGPITIDGLKQNNVELSEEERHGYIHCWKIIGHLIGIELDLLPDSYTDSWRLVTKVIKHQAASSEEGMELTKSYLDLHREVTGNKLFDEVPDFMVRYFLQDVLNAAGLNASAITKPSLTKYEKLVSVLYKLMVLAGTSKTLSKGFSIFQNIPRSFNISRPRIWNKGLR